MLHQKSKKVNMGSSLTFSAPGGWGKEKYNAAKKFFAAEARARREEGARGRNPAAPERWGGKRLVLAKARKQSPQKLIQLIL